MPKGYNSLNNININTFEIGICPICSRRLTAECEHRTDESEAWYAAQILAEQELHNDEQSLPWEVVSDTVAVYPKEAAKVMDDMTDYLDLKATEDNARY